MFTGLVEEIGECLWLRQTRRTVQLSVAAEKLPRSVYTGDSVAINGCCLTVTSHPKGHVTFDLLEETMNRTNLRLLRPGSKVNLERALRADARLGGHFVQGHIDCMAKIKALDRDGADLKIAVLLPPEYSQYTVPKGSICVNGVSLTVGEVTDDAFAVWVIPHTAAQTNLGQLVVGDTVNLEFDILAKYTERLLIKHQIAR